MNRFDSIDASSINRVRINPKQTNEIGNASSLLGLWILLPLAISGLAFVGVHIIMRIFFGNSVTINWNQVLLITWLLVSIICQSIYWMRITKSLGLTSFAGLWSLVPVAGWFKTFRFAYLAVGKNKGYPSYRVSAVQDSDTGHFESMPRIRADNRRKAIVLFPSARKFSISTKGRVVDALIGLIKFGSKLKKPVLVILNFSIKSKFSKPILLTLIFAVISFSAISKISDYYDDRSKNSAARLLVAFYEVAKPATELQLDFDEHSEKLTPLIENFIKLSSVPSVIINTKCDSLVASVLTDTLFRIQTQRSSNDRYDRTVILLAEYIQSCS